jgi:hypothetical protein
VLHTDATPIISGILSLKHLGQRPSRLSGHSITQPHNARVNKFGDALCVHGADRLLEAIGALAERARLGHIPLIYVHHNGGQGEPGKPGTPGWEIHPALAPQRGDLVIDKSGPDAFEATGLAQTLQIEGHRASCLNRDENRYVHR